MVRKGRATQNENEVCENPWPLPQISIAETVSSDDEGRRNCQRRPCRGGHGPGGIRQEAADKSLYEELEISFEPPRRIRRKHIFGGESKDVQLSYEDDLRRTMFSSIDRVTAEIRERFQQLQNLAQKYAFLSQVILSMDELKDQAPQDKEFQLERVRLHAFVAATDLGCKKELIRTSAELPHKVHCLIEARENPMTHPNIYECNDPSRRGNVRHPLLRNSPLSDGERKRIPPN
ncbi:uncharacterized protein TNCV_691731 [Trichonephila clavipes]|nr:uncharacterized protein TNCV_691731 [Trichonephila clavipes]